MPAISRRQAFIQLTNRRAVDWIAPGREVFRDNKVLNSGGHGFKGLRLYFQNTTMANVLNFLVNRSPEDLFQTIKF